jgi:CubicO group peptidase (beta-lactamase class C family)
MHTGTDRETDQVTEALAQIDEWIGPQGVGGAAAVVWRNGQVVAERYAGEGQPGLPVDERTLFALASVTKPIIGATAMALVEDGLIALDEPVVRFVPEFAAGSAADDPRADTKEAVTLRHLLSHTSGLPEDLTAREIRYTDQPSLNQMIDEMCRLPLLNEPGEEVRYSNAGFGVLGRLIERVSGSGVWQTVDERVLAPLDLRNVAARPGPALAERIALVTDVNYAGTEIEPYNGHYWRDLGIPWGGLYGSARDLARFAGAFLDNGPALLSRASVRMMTSDQARGVPGGVEAMKVRWPVAYWGLGWEVKGTKQRHWTGELTSPRTFCHFGAAGTLLWADPDRQFALAVFGNRTTYHLWPFVPARWARLSNALIAAVS